MEWKKSESSHDDFWTDFIQENPSFGQMVAIIIGTQKMEVEKSSRTEITRFKNIYIM